jgi:hypothetical protein
MIFRKYGHLLLLLLLAPGVSAQQPREQKTPAPTTAIVAGVVRDAQDGRPLRRARVSISGSELEAPRVVITTDDGAFTFEGLRAGAYSLTASKDGHVAMSYGASRPGRAGRLIALTAGAVVRTELRLPPGAVITGTVQTPEGEPAVGVAVGAFVSTYDPNRGGRRHTLVPNSTVVTDDRGIYRIFGLAEGTHWVAVTPRMPGANADLQVLSPGEIRSALAEVRQNLVATRPGMPASAPRSADEPIEPRRSVTLAPVYFPGTPMMERATPILLRAGEVRNNINIDLEYLPTSRVEGFVSVPPGTRVVLSLASSDPTMMRGGMRSAVASDDGRFSFAAVAPGTYSIQARSMPRDVRSTAMPAEVGLVAQTKVVVAGEDITGISLSLMSALSLSGTIVLEGSDSALPPLPLRIPVPAFEVASPGISLPSVLFEGSRFSIRGVFPGVYRFSTTPRGIRAPIGRWWLKSMTIGGKELLDAELELRESRDDLVITLSDRASELSGVVRDTAGATVSDGFVVVFSADERSWFHHSRRVAGARLTSEGKYVVRNLPAGEYLVAVTNDIGMNEWFDPEVLKLLVRSSVRLSLSNNETRVLDLAR